MRARKDWLEWFRVDRDLPEHPKVFALAAAAGWSQHETVGRLIAFWAWVARYAPRGKLGRSEAEAARKLGHDIDKLIAGAFIERVNSDALEVRNWQEFNGHIFKERDRKRRGTSAESPGNFPAIPTPNGTGRNGTEVSQSQKTAAAPREAPISLTPDPNTRSLVGGLGRSLGVPKPVPRQQLDKDTIANIAAPLGMEGTRTVFQVVTKLWNSGLCHQPILNEIARMMADAGERIRNPYAYFNPKGEGFQRAKSAIAARLSEAEGEALKAAEREWLNNEARAVA